MVQTKSFRIVASEVPFEHDNRDKIEKTFFAVSDYYKKHPNPGACHLISSIFYVLLKEQGIDNELCLGEVTQGSQFFDHSWVEVDDRVFDIAIQLTYNEQVNPPVFADYDLSAEEVVDRVYGAASAVGLDNVAQQVLKTSFVSYLNGYSRMGGESAWKIIKKIGKELRLKLDENKLQVRYKDTKRKYISDRTSN